MRVVTHPRILDPPSTVEQALAALDGLLESPSLRVLAPGPRFPELLAQAVKDGDARGNLTFDAEIAAVCIEQGASQLLTEDRDFRRFPRISIVTLDTPPA